MSSFFMQSYGQSEKLAGGFCNKSRWGGRGGRWNRRTKKPGTQRLTLVNILASVDGPAYHLLGSVFLLFLNNKPVRQPFLITQTLAVNHLGATTAALKQECKVSEHPNPKPMVTTPKLGMANASTECLSLHPTVILREKKRKRPNLQQFYSFTVIGKVTKFMMHFICPSHYWIMMTVHESIQMNSEKETRQEVSNAKNTSVSQSN